MHHSKLLKIVIDVPPAEHDRELERVRFRRKAASALATLRRVTSGRYGMKIRPLGATTPLTATWPTAPVFRLIVPRELSG